MVGSIASAGQKKDVCANLAAFWLICSTYLLHATGVKQSARNVKPPCAEHQPCCCMRAAACLNSELAPETTNPVPRIVKERTEQNGALLLRALFCRVNLRLLYAVAKPILPGSSEAQGCVHAVAKCTFCSSARDQRVKGIDDY
eukprot:5416768-Pleurochrysis_carterae.AAC.2